MAIAFRMTDEKVFGLYEQEMRQEMHLVLAGSHSYSMSRWLDWIIWSWLY